MTGVLGVPTPDDERSTATQDAFTGADPFSQNGSAPSDRQANGQVSEPKPAAPPPPPRPFWMDQYDPGTDRTQPRARGTEGLSQALWPPLALLGIAGVAVLSFWVFRDPLAIMASAAVAAVAVLMADHYVD